MSNEEELVVNYFAPRARVFGPKINKINGPVELGSNHALPRILHLRIDLHKGPRSQEWVERVVLESDETIETMA